MLYLSSAQGFWILLGAVKLLSSIRGPKTRLVQVTADKLNDWNHSGFGCFGGKFTMRQDFDLLLQEACKH